MTNPKPTPGPWRVTRSTTFDDSGNLLEYPVIYQSGDYMGDKPIARIFNTTKKQFADAALIAAAPEMLEALEALNCKLTELNSDNKLNGMGLDLLIKQAFEASEKARGGK